MSAVAAEAFSITGVDEWLFTIELVEATTELVAAVPPASKCEGGGGGGCNTLLVKPSRISVLFDLTTTEVASSAGIGMSTRHTTPLVADPFATVPLPDD